MGGVPLGKKKKKKNHLDPAGSSGKHNTDTV